MDRFQNVVHRHSIARIKHVRLKNQPRLIFCQPAPLNAEMELQVIRIWSSWYIQPEIHASFSSRSVCRIGFSDISRQSFAVVQEKWPHKFSITRRDGLFPRSVFAIVRDEMPSSFTRPERVIPCPFSFCSSPLEKIMFCSHFCLSLSQNIKVKK